MLELNRIYNEDCLVGMRRIPDHSVDCIICDPPYGITKRNSWDNVIPFALMWREIERVAKDNAPIILFGSGLFTAKLITSNEKLYRYSLVWEKTTPTGFLNANRQPLRIHEDICVFYKNKPVYNPQKTFNHKRKISTADHKRNCKDSTNYNQAKRVNYNSTERFPTSVLKFSTDKQKFHFHPTQKPIGLIEFLIKTYSDEGNIILDFCMGSGTTAIACLRTNRNYIGFESDKSYCDVAQTRIQEYFTFSL